MTPPIWPGGLGLVSRSPAILFVSGILDETQQDAQTMPFSRVER
jgi:hypothetical protein